MINILITAIGGDIGQGVLKSLKISSYKNQIKIIGTDINAKAAGLFMCDKGYIVESVAKNKEKYFKQIIAICKKEKINIAFVCNEDEQYSIASNIEKIKKRVNAYFVVQPAKTISICKDKLETYKFLSKNGIRYPDTYVSRKGIQQLINKHGFPIILKPRSGYGGFKKFHIINSKKELTYWLRHMPKVIAQEYIIDKNDEEYTVGLFLNNNSKVLGAIPMLRKLRFSLTWHATVDDYPDVVDVAVKAAEAVKAIGPCNVQLRRDRNNQPCVIEINSRISSTAIFRAKLGFNESEASVGYFLKNKKPNLKYKKAAVMRIWSELIVPLKSYKKLEKTNQIVNKNSKALNKLEI